MRQGVTPKMAYRYTLEILAVISVIAFCALFLYTKTSMSGAEFAGSDNAGSELVANLTGTSSGKFPPCYSPVGTTQRRD